MSAPAFDAHVELACQNALGEGECGNDLTAWVAGTTFFRRVLTPGILWDDRTQQLHWVDIDRAEVHS